MSSIIPELKQCIKETVNEQIALLSPKRLALEDSRLSPREHINQIARKNRDADEIREFFSSLYSEYSLKTHTNPSVRAKKGNYKNTIDYIEQEGNIELLEAIAIRLNEEIA